MQAWLRIIRLRSIAFLMLAIAVVGITLGTLLERERARHRRNEEERARLIRLIEELPTRNHSLSQMNAFDRTALERAEVVASCRFDLSDSTKTEKASRAR